MHILKALAFWLACMLLASPGLAARDWTRTVKATEAGGYLIGNPAAPVKVIEYFSLTCPHCRHFAETGMAPLRTGYIAKGKVSLELRNFVLNAPDLVASVLMRCGSPAQAVHLFEAVYANQEKLFGGVYTMGKDAADRVNAAPIEHRGAALARESGIDSWFAANGLSPKQATTCLADPKREQALVDMRRQAVSDNKVQGTPSFFVNGEKVEGTGWDDLEPAITKALGG